MPRDSEPLVDPTLDRELEALLAIEPSPQFSARVISAVASERPRWPLSWVLAPAGVIAAAALAILLVMQLRSSAPTPPTLAARPFASPLAAAPEIEATTMSPADPVTHVARSDWRAARHARPDARTRPTEVAVLVPLDESRALGQWLARSRPMQVVSVTDDSPLPLSADAASPVRPLVVPRLAIEPLQTSEDLPGGARP